MTSISLATGSFKLSETLFAMQVCSAIFKDLTALEKKRFNSSAISVSSFRISPFSMSFIFLPKVLLFVKNGVITFWKVLLLDTSDFSFFFIKLAATILLLLVGF